MNTAAVYHFTLIKCDFFHQYPFHSFAFNHLSTSKERQRWLIEDMLSIEFQLTSFKHKKILELRFQSHIIHYNRSWYPGAFNFELEEKPIASKCSRIMKYKVRVCPNFHKAVKIAFLSLFDMQMSLVIEQGGRAWLVVSVYWHYEGDIYADFF